MIIEEEQQQIVREPVITPLNITPTTSSQVFNTVAGIDGYAPVSVSGVGASIDANIQPENIKDGVSILGVSGNVVELKAETQNVELNSVFGKTFSPSTGYNGISAITVTPKNEPLTINPTKQEQTIITHVGYSGYGTVTVNPVTSSIDSNITAENIKSGVTILGVTGNYSGSDSMSLKLKVNSSGTLVHDNTNVSTVIDLGGATDLSAYILANAYTNNLNIFGAIDFSSLTTVSGNYACQYMFHGCTGLTSIDLSGLTTVNGSNACGYMFQICTGLTSIDLSSLTTLSGSGACYNMFNGCTGLTSVDLSDLTTLSGAQACYGMFQNCTGLTSVDLSSLRTVSGQYACQRLFYGCITLSSLSFPALKSTSFGSYTNQFNNMLQGVTGCTVHFPSNLQSVIGSWSDVTAGFGGTNTTVLFDLPATE